MKHLVCTDLHGQKKLYDKLMESIANEQYTIYFLGDAVDRGADGYEIMKKLLNDPNVVYIKGNHEDLFVKSAREFLKIVNKHCNGDFTKLLTAYNNKVGNIMSAGYEMALHAHNGGEPTMIAWILDGCPTDILDKLDNLPTHASYENFDMCHAGCSIKDYDANNTNQMIWNREHFYEPWKNERTLLFGHTPTPTLSYYGAKTAEYNKPVEFNRGTSRKIDLDCGAFFTGNFAVYNMDADNYIVLN